MTAKRSRLQSLAHWLETHWVNPAFAGWLLGGLATFFFLAGTNTLAGWLYVISGVSFALLLLGAILPERSLRAIQVSRRPISPVSVGDVLTIELQISNQASRQARSLLEVVDVLPAALGLAKSQVLERLPPAGIDRWTYTTAPVVRRGIYRWQQVHLRTAAPLGLCWCRRLRQVRAVAVVYPTVLPLARCPLVDELGRDTSRQRHSLAEQFRSDQQGITRALRPYRWGDPIRLVHWRSSARYGELRVRELERATGTQDLVIALDQRCPWEVQDFEQAVSAAASLYFYALRQNLNVRLWSAETALIQGNRPVLEALAAIQPASLGKSGESAPPSLPMVWLTTRPSTLGLPSGSRLVLWGGQANAPIDAQGIGLHLLIQAEQPLQGQLQRLLSRI